MNQMLFFYTELIRIRYHYSLPPPKEVMFLVRSVCLSVGFGYNWKSCEQILTKFLGVIGHDPETNEFNFGDDSNHRPDPRVRSPKSGFTGLSNYQRILMKLYRAGVWPRDQLITFCWRYESLSGSGSPFQITIWIREELPQFYSIMLAFVGGLSSLSTSRLFYWE